MRQAQENKVVVQAQLANLEEKWVLLEGKDYYIAHSELFKVKEHLRQKGVFVLLGSEWLASQQLSTAEKEAYLKNQPLLPYTIILEQPQVKTVESAMKQVKQWSQDIPLLFLVKSNDSLRERIVDNEQFLHLSNQLFIFQPQSHNLFTSAESLKQYKEEMEQQIETVKNNASNLIDNEDKYLHVRERINSFYQSYNEEMINDWRDEKNALFKQVEALKASIKTGNLKKVELKQLLGENQNDLKNLEADKRNVEGICSKLHEYIPEHNLHHEKNQDKQEYEKSLSELEKKIELFEQQKTDNYELIIKIEQALSETKRMHELHEKDFLDYQLREEQKVSEVTIGYEELKVEVDTVLEQLKKRQSNRVYVDELLKKAKEKEQEALTAIVNTGVEQHWLKENARWVSTDEIKQAEALREKKREEHDEIKKKLYVAEKQAEKFEGVLTDRIKNIKEEYGCEPYLSYSETNHQLEYSNIQEELSELQKEYVSLEEEMKSNEAWLNENEEAYESILDRFESVLQNWWNKVAPLTDDEWLEYRAKPKAVVRRSERDIESINKELVKQQRAVENKFQDYLHKLESTDNSKVAQFIRDVKVIMDDNRIFNYDFVETQFLRIFEGLDNYQKQYEHTLHEQEKNQRILIGLCLRRAKIVYESIMEIQKNSRIKMYQRDIQVIRMDWRVKEEQEAYESINNYLLQVLQDLQKWKQDGMDDDEMDRRAEGMLKTRSLIQVIAPIEDCRITVYKPRKESIVLNQRIEYSSWDEVALWSGGEEYSIYITMFMIMISHIRQQMQGNTRAWKVIVADNPFGRASTPHILEPVFQVARLNKIQLICFTAHKEDSILQRFPVVYSLQLRSAYGKEVMKAEQMETGFYRYDAPVGDDGAQMSFLV